MSDAAGGGGGAADTRPASSVAPAAWTLVTLSEALRAGRISPLEVTREALARIERDDARLRSFITVDAEGALRRARALEGRRVRGPLHGVPLAYKDLFAVRGLATSCGTRTPDYFPSDVEATAVARLTAAGAVTLGKLNMTELAVGTFGDNPHHGAVDNPWRTGHVSGGSSSGAGAAVAAGLAMGALGSDTGGSIRIPAACCGIVGLKPTWGRVSRAGVMPLSWSLDHLGPMTRTVRDAALLLRVIAGHDPRDATSSRRRVADYVAELDRPLGPVRIGIPANYFLDDVDPEVAAAVRAAREALAALGAHVQPVTVPDPALLARLSHVVGRAESAAVHAVVLRERPQELGSVVRSRLQLGVGIPAVEYLQALRLRARLTRQFVLDVFGRVDVLLTPVIPEPPPLLSAVTAGGDVAVVERMGRFSRLTRPFNGLGLPALSVPAGRSRTGVPLAVQFAGRPFDEATVLRVGHAWEQAAATG
jgi:aspartyl-tRNA(Asn)/glutamyl-tRNA(Gln) amidotransferase subunit A